MLLLLVEGRPDLQKAACKMGALGDLLSLLKCNRGHTAASPDARSHPQSHPHSHPPSEPQSQHQSQSQWPYQYQSQGPSPSEFLPLAFGAPPVHPWYSLAGEDRAGGGAGLVYEAYGPQAGAYPWYAQAGGARLAMNGSGNGDGLPPWMFPMQGIEFDEPGRATSAGGYATSAGGHGASAGLSPTRASASLARAGDPSAKGGVASPPFGLGERHLWGILEALAELGSRMASAQQHLFELDVSLLGCPMSMTLWRLCFRYGKHCKHTVGMMNSVGE